MCEEYKVNAIFTAPTALRAIRREDPNLSLISKYDLSSLRTLFVAGERADPSTVVSFSAALGKPVVDNWWQTETGWPICGIQLEGVGAKPGSCGLPLPGWDVVVMGKDGSPMPRPVPGDKDKDKDGDKNEEARAGALAMRLPLPPGAMQTLLGSPPPLDAQEQGQGQKQRQGKEEGDQRFIDKYLTTFPGYFSAEDYGFIDSDGYVYVMSRTDDVINVAGHRLSTGAIEEVLLAHPSVIDAAVVGCADVLKGQLPVAFLVLNAAVGNDLASRAVVAEVVQRVKQDIGAVVSLRSPQVFIVQGLPKTRSGKILRRSLRALVEGEEGCAVPATIEDASPLEAIADLVRSRRAGVGEGKG
jgi:propionyl-CoA synthetase